MADDAGVAPQRLRPAAARSHSHGAEQADLRRRAVRQFSLLDAESDLSARRETATAIRGLRRGANAAGGAATLRSDRIAVRKRSAAILLPANGCGAAELSRDRHDGVADGLAARLVGGRLR